MNVVCTGDGDLVEVQGTAEGAVFGRDVMDRLLDLAQAGCAQLTGAQAGGAGAAAALVARHPGPVGPVTRAARSPGRAGRTSSSRRTTRRSWPSSAGCWTPAGLGDGPARGAAARGPPAGDGSDVEGVASVEAPEVAETGSTFVDNALLKAQCGRRGDRAARRRRRLGPRRRRAERHARGAERAVVGRRRRRASEVDAANLALVLAQCADVPDERRGAAFLCAAVAGAARRDGRGRGGPAGRAGSRARRSATAASATTRCSCRRSTTPLHADGRTTAQMSAPEKDAISHRGRALRALAGRLQALLVGD